MFLMKYLFGDTSKHDIIQIEQGQLFLVRPRSPKGYSECIFKDAAACIRRTSTEHHYQLVIQRAFEEGEEQLVDDAEEGDDARDEKPFLLDEGLHLRSSVRNGLAILAWRDLSGDPGDLFEFVCDKATNTSRVRDFELVAVQCQYERKYRKSHELATQSELEQFSFPDSPIPQASPVSNADFENPFEQTSTSTADATSRSQALNLGKVEVKDASVLLAHPTTPHNGDILSRELAELHLFDTQGSAFVLRETEATATVLDEGNWSYWLQIDSTKGPLFGQWVTADINPVFNFDYLSFIFNFFSEDVAQSWLLRFKDTASMELFQEGLMRALWEQLNEQKWLKAKEDDRDYILEAFQDITMEDAPEEVASEDDEYDEGEDESVGVESDSSEHYDVDEDHDSAEKGLRSQGVNSQLAVGYKHGRSFVVRGNKIGVFKHTPSDRLEFAATINNVQTPKGKSFEPKKVMLHGEDSSLVLQNGTDPHKLYRMDLEYGKVVDEWNVHEDIPVTTFAPEKKFSQMTGEQTFLGLSRNALFRVDPRLSGNKLVDSELKMYMSKNDFSTAATTEKGYIAVASNKGDIRLFDRLGINAKTSLPALGESITGLDVSADGRWVLGTCKTYLLLIDAEQKDGKFAGKLGFERSFGKDSKPRPRRLALAPSHVAQFQAETKSALQFTPAKFNTGVDSAETSIITSTGPFVITWNLQKVLKGAKEPYTIKRYSEEIKADNFKFGSDKNVIVALPNEVEMIAKGSFKKPTRESIATPARVVRSRSSIVNSPY